MLTLLHNPRCSKSRAALELVKDADVTVREYLKDPLSQSELLSLAATLGVRPIEIVRITDAKKLDLTAALADADDAAVAKLIAANPGLMQRPILWHPDTAAVIGRPPENVLALL